MLQSQLASHLEVAIDIYQGVYTLQIARLADFRFVSLFLTADNLESCDAGSIAIARSCIIIVHNLESLSLVAKHMEHIIVENLAIVGFNHKRLVDRSLYGSKLCHILQRLGIINLAL